MSVLSESEAITEDQQFYKPDGVLIGHGDTTNDFFQPISEESESEMFSEPVFNNSYSQNDVKEDGENASLLPKCDSRNILLENGSQISGSGERYRRSKPRGATKPTD